MEIPSGYAQANFVYTGFAVPNGAQWTLGLDVSSYAGDPTDAANDLWTDYDTAGMEAIHAANVVLVRIDVKFGPANTGPSGSKSGSLAGTAGGLADSPNVALLVQKNTAFGGRAGRGRSYIPGVPTGHINEDGSLTSTYRDAMQLVIDDFYAKVAVQPMTPVLLHGLGSPLTVPTEITSVTVDSRVATQRRRLRR